MLQQVYWIAGIIVAAVAVIGLFLRQKNRATNINQITKDSGQSNTVDQHQDIKSSEGDGD